MARLGRAQTVLPGGCRIGARPIDLHLAGLVQMGACPQLEGERLLLTAPAGLHGADITLRFPSVGATETLLLAAALAQGETTLRGAAREPEIEDLAAFQQRLDKYIGRLSEQEMRKLNIALAISIDLIENIPDSMMMCLCRTCEDEFRNTGAYYLYPVHREKKETDICTHCNVRKGLDFVVIRKW